MLKTEIVFTKIGDKTNTQDIMCTLDSLYLNDKVIKLNFTNDNMSPMELVVRSIDGGEYIIDRLTDSPVGKEWEKVINLALIKNKIFSKMNASKSD